MKIWMLAFHNRIRSHRREWDSWIIIIDLHILAISSALQHRSALTQTQTRTSTLIHAVESEANIQGATCSSGWWIIHIHSNTCHTYTHVTATQRLWWRDWKTKTPHTIKSSMKKRGSDGGPRAIAQETTKVKQTTNREKPPPFHTPPHSCFESLRTPHPVHTAAGSTSERKVPLIERSHRLLPPWSRRLQTKSTKRAALSSNHRLITRDVAGHEKEEEKGYVLTYRPFWVGASGGSWSSTQCVQQRCCIKPPVSSSLT